MIALVWKKLQQGSFDVLRLFYLNPQQNTAKTAGLFSQKPALICASGIVLNFVVFLGKTFYSHSASTHRST